MSETFVDLTYRGLALGQRIKLTQVRPSSGYLELPAPMPVGSQIGIATDDGHQMTAVVTGVHEQVGGSERAPGMTVAPALAGPAVAWWQARAALPDLEEATVVASPAPPPAAARAPEPASPMTATPESGPPTLEDAPTLMAPAEPEPDATIAEPIDPAMLELARRDSHEVIDDGRRTTVMQSIDLSALGLDPSSLPQQGAPIDPTPDLDGGSKSGPTKKRRKRR